MHLENQIRRAKYINPNRKVTLSPAEKSKGTLETRTSSHTIGFKAGEPGLSPSSQGLVLHSLLLPPLPRSVPAPGSAFHQAYFPVQVVFC